jgi:hypothetical protein
VVRRKKYLVSAFAAAVLISALMIGAQIEPFAPRYDGKTVRKWIPELAADQPLSNRMIKAFGLNAVPYLTASCRRSLLLHWAAPYLPRSWNQMREERWMHSTAIAHMWLHQLGDDDKAGVVGILAAERDRYNLPRFLYAHVDTNALQSYAAQSTNVFLQQFAARALAVKRSGRALAVTAREVSTFP